MSAIDENRWEVREAIGTTWRWYVGAPFVGDPGSSGDAVGQAQTTPGWVTAKVPGSVGAAMEAAGKIPSPYRGTDSRFSEWMGTRSWVFRTEINADPLRSDERALLRFSGVDPSGSVWLNGSQIASLENLNIPVSVDITDQLKAGGRHVLAVVVDPVPPTPPQVARTDSTRRVAPRMNAGWDFCPPMPHQGFASRVTLDISRISIDQLQVRSEYSNDEGLGRVSVQVQIWSASPGTAQVEVAGVSDTVPISEGVTFLDVQLDVEEPRLWWPRGMGDQALYPVTVVASNQTDDVTRASRSVGFREIRWEKNPGAPEDSEAYTAFVNAVEVPLVGWNWAPAEARYADISKEKLRHLLERVVASNAILLRVWGGGLLESEEFYNACDEEGLLVWQEFSLSSSIDEAFPPEDDEFLAHAHEVASWAIPERTHHPSLAIWGGGNELTREGVPLSASTSPVLAVLEERVKTLDRGRHWLPTSPTGPEFHFGGASDPNDEHDVHGPWEHQGLVEQYRLYNAGAAQAHTEFGVEGAANRRGFEILVPASERWPMDRTNDTMRHLGEWWNNATMVQAAFGDQIEDQNTMRAASQLLQATGLEYAVEANRRRSAASSMVLPWQFAESFPNAWCTAVVDHLGDVKPAYHAVRRSFSSLRTTIEVPAAAFRSDEFKDGEIVVSAWIWADSRAVNDPRLGSVTRVRLEMLDGAGRVLKSARSSLHPSHVVEPVKAVSLTVSSSELPDVGFWRAVWTGASGQEIDADTQVFSGTQDWSSLLEFKTSPVSIKVQEEDQDSWVVTLENRARKAAISVHLTDGRQERASGYAAVDCHVYPLLPGDCRVATVDWIDVAPGDRVLTLHQWGMADEVVNLQVKP